MKSKINQWVVVGDATTLLECGCAAGEQSAQWREKVHCVCGIDVNFNDLRVGNQIYPGVCFAAGQSESLPFGDDRFDTVLLLQTLEHVYDEQQSLREIHRILKPGGRLIVTVPHKGLFAFLDPLNIRHRFPSLFNRFLLRSSHRKSDVYKSVPFHRHYSLEDLQSLMGEGFRTLAVYRGGLLLRPLSVWLDGVMLRIAGGPHALQTLVCQVSMADLTIDYGRASYDIGVIAEKT